MTNGILTALIFIISTLAQLYLLVLLLRLLLPIFRADFRNPFAQAILKLTSPLVIPLRRVLPPIGRVDTATVVVAFAIQYLTILVVGLIGGETPSIPAIATMSVVSLISLTIKLFVFAILIRVILSWVAPQSYNPALAIIYALTDPVLRPFRRIIPPMGGIDLSPLFAMIALMALSIIIEGIRLPGM